MEKAKQRLAELKINTYAGSKINASEMDAKLHAGSQSNVDAKIQTGSDTHSDGDVDATLPIARDMLPADAIKTGSAVWIAVKDITLTEDDKRVIIDGKMLQDQHINFAQRLINQQFPNINGLQLSVMQDKPFKGSTRNALQIIHVRENHWIVAVSHKAKAIHVYDSAFSSLDQTSAATVQNLFRCSLSNISMVPTVACLQLQMQLQLPLQGSQQRSVPAVTHAKSCHHLLRAAEDGTFSIEMTP